RRPDDEEGAGRDPRRPPLRRQRQRPRRPRAGAPRPGHHPQGGQVLGREEEVRDRGHLRIRLQHPQGYLDAQILSRYQLVRDKFQRPPGALPSSMLGYEAMTGSLDDFGFEDYLNLPQDSDSLRIPDMHHGMEVRLGLSKGPICPSFN
uniref:Proteasome maturation factor UMP1 family protein n=2 Tax=Aegilops tauschii subsp. strangulata TaxID=200361 RepID=A0A453PY60_AEGTS